MTPQQKPDNATRAARAATSAGRAAGYCWSEHPEGGLFCTRPPDHSGDHWHTYTKVEWK